MSAQIPKPTKRAPKAKRPIARATKPIARKARPRQMSQSPKARARRAMDKVWSTHVRNRSTGLCELSLTRGLYYQGTDAHHVVRRAVLRLRHVVQNGVFLCREHHAWAHSNRTAFRVWFKNYRPDSWRLVLSILGTAQS